MEEKQYLFLKIRKLQFEEEPIFNESFSNSCNNNYFLHYPNSILLN